VQTLINAPPAPVRLTLARDLVRSIRSGHPWVYRDALRNPPSAPAGSIAELFAGEGKKLIASGLYDPGSPVAFRVCRPEGGALDDAWVTSQLRRAQLLRTAVRSDDTTGYRLVNGEGDGLPGLTIDVYGRTAVIKLDGRGPEQFWNPRGLGEWLMAETGTTGAVCRTRGETGAEVFAGTPETEPDFREHGLKWTAHVQLGQKTGFFLDQRENRRLIRTVTSGKSVLNLFSYTGGFSVSAGAGGARDVTSVDSAGPAIAMASRHWELNGLNPAAHVATCADAFEFLEQAANKKRRWDVVIVDPPSFAPSANSVERAKAAYIRLMSAAARVTMPRGLLAASSCSSHISETAFLEILSTSMTQARRRGRVTTISGQPLDHPWPLACPELRYLKFVLLEVE
jgi:23S rRNA (cytosine1962-C5)-methyltransferase